jgi:predicted ABC-type ATPase
MASDEKRILIIGGPNGAGKTTFAREFLPREAGLLQFVNADLIAEGLSPFHPQAAAFRAGRLMLEQIAAHASAGRSFAFESTLSGVGYARMIDEWRRRGYVVKLVFLALPTAEDAIARVAMRVRQGGHDVPVATIRRRFDAGLRNFEQIYRGRVDFWQWFDNSGLSPVLLDEGRAS